MNAKRAGSTLPTEPVPRSSGSLASDNPEDCRTTRSGAIPRRNAPGWAFAFAVLAWVGVAGAQVAPDAETLAKIEAAIPAKALVQPRKPRKLLIFDLNVGYGGHPSIVTANLAFSLMGKKTGAFETTISRDPAVFKPESLKQFDAVFLNNNVGNLFEDPALRESLVEFVYGGGGLMGVHGTAVAFTRWTEKAREDWPEFAIMLGTRGAFHRASTEQVSIKLDDPGHPLNQCFGGQAFDYRDEFFRPQGTYSRNRDRVLLSIDTEKTDLSKQPHDNAYRADNDYALAWVRQYGRGRVFYSTIAHNPYVFWDARMLEFYLGAIQFVLGDLPAPTTPSAKLSPAMRAQEKLGWRLGVQGLALGNCTLFEAIEKTAQIGLCYLGAYDFTEVSKEIPKRFGPGLTDDEFGAIRLKLDAVGVRMLTYLLPVIPGDEAGCRKLFEFGRKMGIEAFVSHSMPSWSDSYGLNEKFCNEYDICVTFRSAATDDWGGDNPEVVLKACQGRSKRMGACASWTPSHNETLATALSQKERVILVNMRALRKLTLQDHHLSDGTWGWRDELYFKQLHQRGIGPIMFGLDNTHGETDPLPGLARDIEVFNRICVELAK